MKTSFKFRWRKTILYLLVGFIFLFLFRMLYGYLQYPYQTRTNHGEVAFSNMAQVKRNFASNKYTKKMEGGSLSAPAEISLSQKYEKIASIKSKSTEFEEAQAKLKSTIEKHNAIIQFEQNKGNQGNRELYMLLGIPPEKFEIFYQDMLLIGVPLAREITKKDMTNEFRELNARRITLEKMRASLIDLKARSGKIEEYINLENRILDIEENLQGLGVKLGDFDEENEFCTVKYALREDKNGNQKVSISLIHRVKVALEWTIKFYLRILVLLTFASILAFFFLLVVDKLRIITRIRDKFEE